jgi:hypothetical protein
LVTPSPLTSLLLLEVGVVVEIVLAVVAAVGTELAQAHLAVAHLPKPHLLLILEPLTR